MDNLFTDESLVQEQFEVVLWLPLLESLFDRWRLLGPLTLVRGHTIDIVWRSDDVRRQKDQQVRLTLRGGSLLEGPAEEGDIAQTGDLRLGLVVLVADEAADHDSLIIIHNHCSFRRTFRGRDRADFRFGDKGRDFLRQL